MKFPAWVEEPATQTPEVHASKRLNFLIYDVALKHSPSGSLQQLARSIGMDRTTMHLYIRRGYFSTQAAEKLEAKFGANVIRAKWLIDPLAM